MQSYNADNSALEVVDVSDTANARAYCIRLHVTIEAVGTLGKNADPHESSVIDNDKLTDFKIVSLNYFDSLVGAGDLMNDYFLFARSNIYNSSSTVTAMINGHQLAAGTDIRNNKNEGDGYLFLMVEPELEGNYSFATTAYFTSGKTLTDTVSIYLKK